VSAEEGEDVSGEQEEEVDGFIPVVLKVDSG